MLDRAIAGAGLDMESVAARMRRLTVQLRFRGGGGAGIIWRDGLVVTNAHVARTDQAEVVLADGRQLPARLAARDAERDLAGLTMDAVGVGAPVVSTSTDLRPGHVVLALGHPFGVIGALTVGVVHAVGRLRMGDRRARDERSWIQADVRLAPGNSGGPLLDSRGRVVGINSMIVGGIGVAVPAEDVERFVAGIAPKAMLGVTVRAAGAAGLLQVAAVRPGGPGAQAGLKAGDLLVGVEGRDLGGSEDLAGALLRAGRVGWVSLDVIREGRWSRYQVALPRRAKAS